jgi:hypothetical protein
VSWEITATIESIASNCIKENINSLSSFLNIHKLSSCVDVKTPWFVISTADQAVTVFRKDSVF